MYMNEGEAYDKANTLLTNLNVLYAVNIMTKRNDLKRGFAEYKQFSKTMVLPLKCEKQF